MLRNIIFCLLVFCSTAIAAPKGQGTLTGFPKNIAKDSTLTVNTIGLSDGTLLKSSRLKGATKFSIATPDLISLVNVKYLSRKARIILGGTSRKVGPFIKTKKAFNNALRIKLKRIVSPAARAVSLQKAALSSGNKLLVGVPSDGITVTGPKAQAWMGKAQVQMLITEITQGASCYNQNNGFVLVELDPDVLAARQFEFDLCSSGRADPATCATDRYQAPTILIKGELFFSDSAATLTLRQTNSDGTTLSQISVAGSTKNISSWESLTKEAVKSLIPSLCMGGSLTVTKASCETPACNMPCIEGTAFRQLPTIEGSAKGPVGASVSVGFSRDFAMIDCGQWAVQACAANVCCQRTSDSQPEQTSFSAVLDLYNGTCLCPSGQRIVYDVITQLRMSYPIEVGSFIDCPA